MGHNSYTSRFKSEGLFWATLVVGISLMWLGYFLGAVSLSDFLNAQIGTWLERIGKGRIANPQLFFLQIEKETLQILTAPIVLAGIMRWIYISAQSIVHPKLKGLLAAFLVLILLNVWIVVARDTTLFWGSIYFAHPNLKQSAFHFEKILLAAAPATQQKVAVIGSSQGRSQIDTSQLDKIFMGRARFGNLSYAGAAATDFPLMLDHVSATGASTIICYVSEINFYERISASRFLPLLTLKRIPWAMSLAREFNELESGVRYGILAAVLPMFQFRRAVDLAVFGGLAESNFSVPAGKRRPSDEQTIDTFEKRARTLSMKNDQTLQKTEFVKFLREANISGMQVLIIQGQINPNTTKYLQPSMRVDFEKFLQDVTNKFSNVTLITNELPRHISKDYEDTAHIWSHVRRTYTLEVSKFLQLHNYI